MSELDQEDPGHQDTQPQNAIVRKAQGVAATTGADLLKEYLPRAIQTNAGALSVVLGFISVMWSTYHILKFSKYLEEIALEIDCNDPSALAKLLEQHGNEEWFAENLDRGFRQMMEATDSFARKCIVLLVADYLKRRDKPDLAYRRLGALFADSNEDILRMIHRIVGKVCGFTQAGIFAYRKLDLPGARYAVAGHKGASEVDWTKMDLGPCEEPETIDATCSALIRSGFASPWFGDPADVVWARDWPVQESRGFEIVAQQAVIEHHQNRLLELAMRYIGPVARNPLKTEDSEGNSWNPTSTLDPATASGVR